MNLLTTFCALVLGITIGVAFNHNRELDDSLQKNSNNRPVQPINIYTTPAGYITPTSEQTPGATVLQPQSTKAIPRNNTTATNRNLTDLINQQKAIVRQLAEQSKEIQTLTFRQDSYSDKFIPLRKESNSTGSEPSPASGLTPLLPPIQ